MSEARERTDGREVRVQTLYGVIEGNLRLAPRVRTLDHLNLDSNTFLRLYEPRGDLPESSGAGEPVALNRSSVLFAFETRDFRAAGPTRGSYRRAPVSLQVAGFCIRGFVHVPQAGDPLTRLSQQKPRFLALTSASVLGDDEQVAVAFIAVNRCHIVTAQTLGVDADPLAAGSDAVRVGG